MQQATTTITQRGQVTIPTIIRKKLGVTARDKVTFTVDEHGVHLRPAAFTVESTAGSVTPLHRPEHFEQLIREAKEEHAERTMRKLHTL